MTDPRSTMTAALRELETIQAQIGRVQLALLEVLTTETTDQWDESVQAALIKLESVQRGVGEVQVDLLRQVSASQAPEEPAAPAGGEAGPGVAEVPPTWTDPRAWLKARGIEIKALRETSGLDPAADRAALFLGDRFAALEAFYEAIKRRVNGGYGKWFSVADLPGTTISDICQFGTMLHGSGFLSEFKYIKRNRAMLFEPLADGRVTNFFTGGWLERYARQLAQRVVQEATGTWCDDQVLLGPQVVLPNGTEGEFDLLVGLAAGRLLWLECKTGDWQRHIQRFQTLNRNVLGIPAAQAALVLVDRLSAEQKASATALTAMTVLHLTELAAWLTRAVATAGAAPLC